MRFIKRTFKFLLIVCLAFFLVFLFSYYNLLGKFTKKWDSTFQSGLKPQDDVEYIQANDVVWNEIERKASEKHEAPSLDKEFLRRNFDVDSLEDIQKLVKSGMQGVYKDMNVGTKEYLLMKDLMKTKKISYITEDDLNATYNQFNQALDQLAMEKNISKEECLSYYDFSDEEFQTLMKKKASDMQAANQEIMNQLSQSKE